jgi:RimJ/RimL family protein N-acetyltransferase
MKFESLDIRLKNGKTVTLREASVDDAEELISVVKKYIEDSEYIPYTKGEFNPAIEFEKEWIQALNNQKNSLLLLAMHNDKIIGNISVNGSQRNMAVHTACIGIGLLREWRNQGIGSILFNSVIEWAKKNSQLEILWLETYVTNKEGIALYRKYGFEQDGIQKDFIKISDNEYADNLMMSLKLK